MSVSNARAAELLAAAKIRLPFLEQAALVLSGEVSRWTLNNADCYSRVRLWQRAVDELGLDRAEIEAEVHAHPISPAWAEATVGRRLAARGVDISKGGS